MVAENCSVPYRFVCVSDRELTGIDTVPASKIQLDKVKPQGCWVKLDFFRREVSGDGPCIGLDLDVTLVGDIAKLQRSYLHSAQDPQTRSRYMNSSVLSWTPSKATDAVYTKEIPYGIYPRGDQEFIADRCPDYGILPGCYSYRGHLSEKQKQDLPKDATVVFFHGSPTPAGNEPLRHEWNRRTWQDFAIADRVL